MGQGPPFSQGGSNLQVMTASSRLPYRGDKAGTHLYPPRS